MPLHKIEQGCSNKPTLVFLHGFLGSSSDWSETIEYLKDSFHCIAIDLPGHGASVSTEGSLKDGFNHCHGLIKELLNDLNVQKYTLVGYSLGGRVALDYARTQDDSALSALILESSHTGLADDHSKERRFMQDHSWARKFATQSMVETLYEWYDQDIFSDLSDRKKEMIISKRIDNYGVPLANMLLATSLGKQADALPYLQKTTLPVYYCLGGKDKRFKNVSKQLNELQHVQVIEFEQAGHNIHQQNAAQFAAFILKHFTE